ncbi:acyl-CoA-like ligand-binding transcription factor [Nonomuraea sp. SBT364]|uniref:acyl-CoA-like ligand-binding transcription factor n=1 Tax=Nonomuraea sp. SBT364 TaxID=1580530 RepID=UPI00066AC658|nr:TetR family transcriptional regulator [Nonomuraea sp. SBT364]
MSGLRERKKQATREALTLAALRLALERGMEHVRVEDIAAEAGVSPRTFNNYFSSKYEALAARHADRVRRSAEVLRERPGDEPLWEAIGHAMTEPWGDGGRASEPPDPALLAAMRLLTGDSTMRAESLKVAFAADGEFAAAVAARTGTDVTRDLYPHLVAASVTAAVQAAVGHWLHADPPLALVPLLREAIDALAAAVPAPAGGAR